MDRLIATGFDIASSTVDGERDQLARHRPHALGHDRLASSEAALVRTGKTAHSCHIQSVFTGQLDSDRAIGFLKPKRIESPETDMA